MTPRHISRVLLLVMVSLLALAPRAGYPAMVAASTLTVTVNSTADAPDANPGDGICADAAGQCTLRAATQEASAQPSGSTITIDVPKGRYGLTLGTLQLTANNITISGALSSTTMINGNKLSTVMGISNTVQAHLSGLTISGGSAGSGGGGGIYNEGVTVLRQSAVLSNTASQGGGILNGTFGHLTLAGSTITGNSVLTNTHNTSYGGGIYNMGMLTLTSSTISANTASNDKRRSGYRDGYGGGLYNAGIATMTSSTLSGNSAHGPYSYGGGIYNTGNLTVTNSTLWLNGTTCRAYRCESYGSGVDNTGILALTSSTVSGNDSDNSYGTGGGIANSGIVTLTTTILAGNIGQGNPDCNGTLTSGGYNLIGNGDGCGLTNGQNGDQVGSTSSPINPHLGPLQSNGGPTQTMVPQVGSSAIDAVPSSNCTLNTDQRGQSRPDPGDHGACDIGAVETHYSDNQPPQVTAVNPSRGPYTGGTVVVLNGSNLVGPDMTSTVRFGGVVASNIITDPSGALITATSPATGGAGIVDVTVQTSAGTSQRTPFDLYTYTASTLYVATTGSDSNGCLTPSSPCRTIGHAIAVAASGASISVAAGTYTETETIPLSLTLTGAGAGSTIVNGYGGSVVTVNTGITVVISGVTIQKGGGGITNNGTLSVTDSTVSGNSANQGGGIYNTGTLTLTNSTISGNSADQGGGIDNGGTLSVANSTISGNSVSGSYYGSEGGGIYNAGVLTLSNSTLSGNSATASGGYPSDGGGLVNTGTAALANSTISSNSTSGSDGGISNGGILTLTTTIVAGNTASSSGPDCSGTLTSGGYNLVGIGDGCGLTNGVNGDQVGTTSSPIDPDLGPLQNNGGPTQTMAPLAGSSAIDAVAPSACTLSTDQRGQPRPDPGDHGACDVGAVETHDSEIQPPLVTAVTPNYGLYTGGTVVVIEGANLLGPDLAATVSFGGLAASSVITDPSGTLITATSPATAGAGIVDVTVQTSAGTSALTPFDRYTYTASTLYVATSGNDTNGCLTPSDSCRTIGHAVAVAASGATIDVATGRYTETNTIPLSLTLAGAGASTTIIDGNKSSTVVTVTTGSTVAISGVTIQDGSSSSNGGGILNNGTLTLTNSTLSHNNSHNYGNGGGIYNTGTLTLINSTLSDNSAPDNFDYGGGIYNTGTAIVTNSTLSGNQATGGAGGIYNAGTLTLTNSTLSGNTAGYGGGIYNSLGTVMLTTTIVAGNTNDCAGTLTSGGYNLIGVGGCGLINGVNGDQVGSSSNPINPLLGPLANNGGPTKTMTPLTGSPAIDAVAPDHCTLSTDQRGQPRPDAGDHGACDIGAVETHYSDTRPPVVMAVNPSKGPYTGGTVVVLDGTNLVGSDLTATVTFGGVAASSVIADPSGTLITATSPATSGAGIVDVTVQTSAGTSALTPNDRYTYTASTLYVATSGSDTNGCITPSSPCLTISHAITVAAGGATINVAAGTYPTTVTVPLNLTLTGTGAGNTILDGGGSSAVVTVTTGTTVAISGVTIQDGTSSSNGGGILNNGILTLTNSTLSGNSTTGTGAGGGGIYNTGTVTLTNSTLSGNSAGYLGGGGGIYNGGALILTNSTLSGNSSYGGGGGIDNTGTVTLTNSTLSGNSATYSGGGIASDGTVTLTNSTVSGNSASVEGGGIYNAGTLYLTNSTLSSNGAVGGNGGGIYNDFGGTLTLTNSTLSGNSSYDNGGGIDNAGRLTLVNSTLSGNGAGTYGYGGGIYIYKGTAALTATILARNTAYNNPDCYGTLTSGGYNLIGIGDGCGLTNGHKGDQVGSSSSPINPLLGPLANNGGPTQTMAELPGSPAIDHGGTSATSCPATDQRGLPRPDEAADNGACDVGAYEAQRPPSLTLSPTSGSYQQSLTLSGTNFAANEVVNIYPDSTSNPVLYSATTDGSGSFVLTDTVRQGTYGVHPLIAVGQTSGLSVTAPFTVLPTLVLTPSSGAAGATVTATGYGFGATEGVAVHWGTPTGPLLGTATSNNYGTFANGAALSFTVPSSTTAGTYQVYAVGQSSGAQTSTSFTVP